MRRGRFGSRCRIWLGRESRRRVFAKWTKFPPKLTNLETRDFAANFGASTKCHIPDHVHSRLKDVGYAKGAKQGIG
jgi:hypothetical protein